MKTNNKGFTLVELIVCLVIFGIVVAAIFGFMLAGSRSYKLVNDRLELQTQYQLATSQINEYIIDCTGGIYFDSSTDTLFVLNGNSGGTATAHIFQLKADGCIYYGTANATVSDKGELSCGSYSANDFLTENVTDFAVNPTLSAAGYTASASVLISFEKGSAEYSGQKTVALRNKPPAILKKL